MVSQRDVTSASSAWRRVFGPLVENWQALAPDLLGPMLRVPKHPILMACFALRALRSAESLVRGWHERDQALFAGLAAHSFLPLDEMPSASFGLILGALAHAVGWPMPRGGSQQISNAL